ncbi:MAG TPA: DNA polymerase III subunit delta' C-terminal domain-containing protein, partial [Terriglobia bacterium]|nr:DNA polymerase III subunit delta' C-terminal domain-containing protein [Terriglobia bacterium]
MVAKALNCLKAEPGAFCDECSSCRKINSGVHPDVMMISVEEEATQIKIAQIRRLLDLLQLQPLEGRNKIFIIDPADMLNAEAANALLKGLEEPPESTFFILITVNVHELLLTVRSRSQVYNFTPLTLDEIRQHGVTDELLVRWSQGSIGRARSMDIVRLKSEREIVLDFLETTITASEEQFQDLLGVSAELGRAKQEFEERLAILSVLIADVLYLQEGLPEKLVNIDIRDRLAKLGERAAVDHLIRMGDFLRFIESSLKSNVNRHILTDVLALTGNKIVHGLS